MTQLTLTEIDPTCLKIWAASAPWMPVSLSGGMPLKRFRFTASERRVYRKRRKIPVSEWCEKHRVVTMSSLPGKWRNEVTSYLAGIMDASFFPSVETVIICKAPQTGGSEAVNNCIGYAADRAPGPVLYVYPDELTSRENNQDRIQPMFTSSLRLRTKTGRRGANQIAMVRPYLPIEELWGPSVPVEFKRFIDASLKRAMTTKLRKNYEHELKWRVEKLEGR